MADNMQDFLLFLEYLREDDDVERRLEGQKIVWDYLHKHLEIELSIRDVSKEIWNQLKSENVRNIILLEIPKIEKELQEVELMIMKIRFYDIFSFEESLRRKYQTNRDIKASFSIFSNAMQLMACYLISQNSEEDVNILFNKQTITKFSSSFPWVHWNLHLSAKEEWIRQYHLSIQNVKILKNWIKSLKSLEDERVTVYCDDKLCQYENNMTDESQRFVAWEREITLDQLRHLFFEEDEEEFLPNKLIPTLSTTSYSYPNTKRFSTFINTQNILKNFKSNSIKSNDNVIIPDLAKISSSLVIPDLTKISSNLVIPDLVDKDSNENNVKEI
ncbi:15649_t:CDS:2 [Cetraspora pellucida]|uniref:15649_t:CDS:1 n=1 Tax=Cetraspora pellucida TaxID=1433469 RepID=A0A9N9AMN7_9GLOM|nr:15649_t:CDS:2 [Cetraspora pellucida]